MKTAPFTLVAAIAAFSGAAIAQPGYSYAPDAAPPPDVEIVEDDEERTGVVFVPRLGLQAGAGALMDECQPADCEDGATIAYEEDTALLLSADLLWHTSRHLRLGVALGFVPEMSVQAEETHLDLGSYVSVGMPIEGIFDLSKTTALTVRGQIDLGLLFPSDDLKDAAQATEEVCDSLAYDLEESCTVDHGPYIGASIGLGAGVVIDAGPIGFRADLLLQAYTIDTLTAEWDDGSTSSVRFSGSRVLFLAGLEI